MKMKFVNKKIGIVIISFILLYAKLFSQYGPTSNERIKLNSELKPFYHGVASGDPLHDRVIIWTRVTPDSTVLSDIEVEWYIGTDTLCQNIINSGTFTTNSNRDYTVKVDVTGLEDNTWYYYYFRALGSNSLIGRTKTTPSGDTDSIRFALVSGSNYNSGFFQVYENIAKRNDIDAVLHLGDYIYEYGTNHYGETPGRELQPDSEIIVLSDYRIRYSHYRLDDDLRYLHQQYPWYIVWDDHETANNSYKDGAENHAEDGSEGDWYERRDHGVQAFMEWIPIREPDPNPMEIYHTVNFGDLMNVYFLETRLLGRDSEDIPNDDSTKTILGQEQYNWLLNELQNSTAQWNVIAQQVMMAPLKAAGISVNSDQWDGFEVERQKILEFIIDNDIKNVVVLTGDIHTSWANDLPYQKTMFDYESAGVEFVTTSVASPSTNSFLGGLGAPTIVGLISHVKYCNLDKRGYTVFDVTKEKAQGDYYLTLMQDIQIDSTAPENFDAGWCVANNERKLTNCGTATERNQPLQPQAPLTPIQETDIKTITKNYPVLLGAYPNPFKESITIQYYMYNREDVQMQILSTTGNINLTKNINNAHIGVNYKNLDLSTLAAGTYFVVLKTKNGIIAKQILVKM